MLDFILEVIAQIIYEIIPDLLKLLGASIKWLIYLGKKPFSKILEEEWNRRFGFFIVLILFYFLVIRNVL